MRVAINGFGRIGRSVFRILDKRADAEVVAINDVFDHAALCYLLNYDTVMGRFEGTLRLEGNELVTSHGRTRMLQEKDPHDCPGPSLLWTRSLNRRAFSPAGNSLPNISKPAPSA